MIVNIQDIFGEIGNMKATKGIRNADGVGIGNIRNERPRNSNPNLSSLLWMAVDTYRSSIS